jgi:hypothetical protein
MPAEDYTYENDDFVGPMPEAGGGGFPGLGGAPMAGLKALLGGLSGLFQPSAADQFENKFKGGATDFLARGGGVRNAQDIYQGERKNMLADAFGFTGAHSPEATAARAGRGPGGGLGVFSDVDQWHKENAPEFKEQSGVKKFLGGLAGGLFG